MKLRSYSWIFAMLINIVPASLCASQDTQAQLDELRERIDRITANLNQDKAELSSVQQELAKVEKTMGNLNLSIRRTKNDIENKSRKIKESEFEIAQIEEEIIVLRSQLRNIIVASYISGRAEYLKLLLNQEDPAHLGRFLAYYRYLSRHRVTDLLEYESTVDRLHRVQSELESENQELKALETAQLSQRNDLTLARSERGALVTALEQDIGSKQQQLTRMKQNAQRLQRLLRSIDSAVPDSLPRGELNRRFDQMRGKLNLPLHGNITANFGETRWGTDIPWQGVFMDAAEGTAVKAIFPGRVAFADWLRGFGLLLILDHGDGFMSLYSHNQLLLKQVGEWVEEGESIALVGASGGLTTSGLYFEVRKNGEPQNPMNWCKVE